ncbi:27 kDa hemolymph protein isoform X2 [Eurytemora carolleeae]|uniref:27 kDa hemolymph protein isoform X2 n=1 Tax=Eurytemora carolleeae TaxID=1294199 RepID=UPI000C769320|nr:27 kDa hemolymph protein isoform X2 [Eurytemora carolleeae]|eukprot:XP_023337441.1 27 kDa hemolymph protein-like isoform X2 [Eurytemora affinis]
MFVNGNRFLNYYITTVWSDDDDFFDDSFHEDFDDLEKQNEFSGKIEDGWRNWEERCLEIGGEKILESWQREQEQLIYCFTEQFDQDTILREIEDKKKSGDLDEVFKKYCGSPISKLRSCLENFLTISHQCLHQEDRVGLNITLKMVDAAINFTCHNSGDRIALFMAESGMDCVQENKEHILTCLNKSVPEIFQNDGRNGGRMHFYVFQQENCRYKLFIYGFQQENCS